MDLATIKYAKVKKSFKTKKSVVKSYRGKAREAGESRGERAGPQERERGKLGER